MPPITRFLKICKTACDTITPFVQEVYKINLAALQKTNAGGPVAKIKPDKTAFTIADGIVQFLLVEILFFESENPNLFQGIVGEEKNVVNINNSPYTVDELQVPVHLNEIINKTAENLKVVAKDMRTLLDENTDFFNNISLFIDPIDGTKQFVTGKGEMCAIMIGLVRDCHPVGGIVYRPLSFGKTTYGIGSQEEKLFELERADPTRLLKQFDLDLNKDSTLMLRSKSSVSPFLDTLRDNIGAQQVRVSGAGNKILKLIEIAELTQCSVYYIQDRGISRWDSCAGEAILDAYGGGFYKLSSMLNYTAESEPSSLKYHYRKVKEGELLEEDVDLSINVKISNTNTTDLSIWDKDNTTFYTEESKKYMTQYGNFCGLFATVQSTTKKLSFLQEHLAKAAKIAAPWYT